MWCLKVRINCRRAKIDNQRESVSERGDGVATQRWLARSAKMRYANQIQVTKILRCEAANRRFLERISAALVEKT